MEKLRHVEVPVVIDTNVLVPSLYRETHILNFILKGNLVPDWNDFILCEALEIIDELAPTYYKKCCITPEEIKRLLELIFATGINCSEMPEDWPPASPDRDDDPFLYAAQVSGAEYIISNDTRHMLKLKEFRGIPIGTPQ